MSSLIKTDDKYRAWITDIARRFQQSQLRAAVSDIRSFLPVYSSVLENRQQLVDSSGDNGNRSKLKVEGGQTV